MRITEFKADDTKQEAGVWWQDPDTDLRLLVAHIGNRKFQKYVRGSIQSNPALRRSMRDGKIDFEANDEIERIGMSRFVLLGWENLEDEDGGPIAYSQATAAELLKVEKFRSLVRDIASDWELFKAQLSEDSSGN